MLHPSTELRFVSPEIGYGVFAVTRIPRGTITWVRDALDQTFTPAKVAAMSRAHRAILDKYTFVDARGDHVLCWDHGRFVNHSCRAKCLSAGYEFEIAVRDIEVGEELTDDYGTLNITESFQCACGVPECRKVIHPDDMPRMAQTWDALVKDAFPLLRSVEQPLWEMLSAHDRAAVERGLAGGEIASCMLNYAGGRAA